jgi:hypothetical protein
LGEEVSPYLGDVRRHEERGRKIGRTSLTLILVFTLLSPGAGFVFASEPIGFTLSLDKKEYSREDSIQATFTLKNKSKKPVYVNKRFHLNREDSPKEHRDVYLTVISPSGESLPCKIEADSYKTGLPKTDHFALLHRGEEASNKRAIHIKHFFDFSKPGKYKISATYRNIRGKELGLKVYNKELKSKPVTIRMLKK